MPEYTGRSETLNQQQQFRIFYVQGAVLFSASSLCSAEEKLVRSKVVLGSMGVVFMNLSRVPC